MGNLLATAKKVLTDHAIELFQIFGEDIPLEKEEFQSHYSRLGEVLFEIESILTLNELFNKLTKGEFEMLGYCPDDEDMLEEFLRVVNEFR
jgi:hypothetical protein